VKEQSKETGKLIKKVSVLLGDKLDALPKVDFELPLTSLENLKVANSLCKTSREQYDNLVI